MATDFQSNIPTATLITDTTSVSSLGMETPKPFPVGVIILIIIVVLLIGGFLVFIFKDDIFGSDNGDSTSTGFSFGDSEEKNCVEAGTFKKVACAPKPTQNEPNLFNQGYCDATGAQWDGCGICEGEGCIDSSGYSVKCNLPGISNKGKPCDCIGSVVNSCGKCGPECGDDTTKNCCKCDELDNNGDCCVAPKSLDKNGVCCHDNEKGKLDDEEGNDNLCCPPGKGISPCGYCEDNDSKLRTGTLSNNTKIGSIGRLDNLYNESNIKYFPRYCKEACNNAESNWLHAYYNQTEVFCGDKHGVGMRRNPIKDISRY